MGRATPGPFPFPPMTLYPASRPVPGHPRRVYCSAPVPVNRFPLRVSGRETARNGLLVALMIVIVVVAAWCAA